MYVGLLIKPDTHRRGLFDTLKKEFILLGYNIAVEKDIILNHVDVEYLYPESYVIPAGKKALNSYLTAKKSTVWLFLLSDTKDQAKEIEKLQKIKGDKEKRTGLRSKYNEIPILDSEIESKTGNYYRYMMENLFHVFDNQEQINYFLKLNEKP